jgi:hypothetical protein
MYRILALLAVAFLSGCSSYGIRYGYSDVSEPNEFKDIPYQYRISSAPDITLKGFCAGQQHSILVGPYIIIPLPVIPAIFGMLDLHRTKNTKGYISLELEAPPTETYVKSARLSLYVDGELVQPSKTSESEGYWKITKNQTYQLGLSCEEMEQVQLTVVFDSDKQNLKSKSISLAKVWGRLFP